MDIVVLLYDGVSAAEALGPVEVLRRVPDTTVRFVAEEPGPQRAHSPPLDLEASHQLDQVQSADVLVIPGGFGSRALVSHEALLEWIRRLHATTQWTTGVSTGSVLLAAAGVLAGLEATTHWLAHDLLAQYGAVPVTKRVVRAGTVITAVGPAAAIDMALWVASRSAGRQRAEEIRAELATAVDEAFDPETSYKAAATVRGWHDAGQASGPTTKRLWSPWRIRPRTPRRVIRDVNVGRDGGIFELDDVLIEDDRPHRRTHRDP